MRDFWMLYAKKTVFAFLMLFAITSASCDKWQDDIFKVYLKPFFADVTGLVDGEEIKARIYCDPTDHKTKEIYVSGEDTGTTFPDFGMDSGKIESNDFLSLCSKSYSFHTSSYLVRSEKWKGYINNPPKFRQVCDVGDEPFMMYFGHEANVYYINEVMSAYRRGVPTSWTRRNTATADINKLIKHPKAMIETYLAFDEYTDNKYHDLFVPKTAIMKLKVGVYTKKCKQLLKKSEREYFKALPVTKRAVIVAAAVFPGMVLKHYLGRLKRLNKRKGYL